MCGRFSRKKADKQRIAEAFSIHTDDIEEDFAEEADCAPGSMQPVVYETKEGERAITAMRWGFKLPDRLLFNTKSEGVLESRFWQPRMHQRCIIPANAFFEWKHDLAKPAAKPGPKYEIAVPSRSILGFAGLWSNWQNPKTNQWERTFSIFTSEPNALMRTLHNRQPVILEPSEYEAWLAPSERPPVHLLRIFPKEKLEAHPVESERKPAPEPIPTTGFLF
jgi:putative SOS response-associated peptidase YedK